MVSIRRSFQFFIALLPISNLALAKKQEVKEPPREIDSLLQLRTHSLFAPYIDQDLQNRWWDFGGDAYVNTAKHIRLTRAVPSQMGWLWSRLPMAAHHFQIELEFKISGQQSHLYGDGLALWLTTERAQPGPVFGSIDKFTGLGIFIDTYSNGRHNYSFPRVSAMLGDGQTSYPQGEDGEPVLLAGCSAGLRRSNVATKLQLTYIQSQSLDVKLQYKAWDEWTDCMHIEPFKLPDNPYFGISAMTGDVSDAHDVISVTASAALLAPPGGSARSSLQSPHVKKHAAAEWLTFKGFLKFVFFGTIFALLVVVARTYARQKGGLRIAGVEVLGHSGGLGSFARRGATRF